MAENRSDCIESRFVYLRGETLNGSNGGSQSNPRDVIDQY